MSGKSCAGISGVAKLAQAAASYEEFWRRIRESSPGYGSGAKRIWQALPGGDADEARHDLLDQPRTYLSTRNREKPPGGYRVELRPKPVSQERRRGADLVAARRDLASALANGSAARKGLVRGPPESAR